MENQSIPTDPDYAQGYEIMFTGCFTLLIASQGSLDALNEILKEPVPMNCFRPNIIVDGCQPYSEDPWKTIKINNLIFQRVKLCNHCKRDGGTVAVLELVRVRMGVMEINGNFIKYIWVELNHAT
ncbi:mitochondrial amidoxime reducing component 2-like isoform X3 [Panicum virgatum]|uniref:mitochondrial amidoxime reducing component 2-like isoform X3 n=1 Tax=Panicum virgatum TaxID=38727 RepID=UPI0019D5F564|nr:mitochondrial amidoxime reducing component 2-like isoform X3 [Panicum virgatum]